MKPRGEAEPLLDEMRTWLDNSSPQVPPQTATSRALSDLEEQREKLVRYLGDGPLRSDSNLVVNALRLRVSKNLHK